ncbi:hypothetical protein [Pontibacter chitinilyticus]|uniref:hypothetical protein n=1 Tax=Pontibacter chitinilyticus TaxID=2674989 RepID=UPI00321AB113
MDQTNWNNRNNTHPSDNQYRDNNRPVDEDRYRGAYRFDTHSPDRNETTYNGFDDRQDNARGNRQPYGNSHRESFYANSGRQEQYYRSHPRDYDSDQGQHTQQYSSGSRNFNDRQSTSDRAHYRFRDSSALGNFDGNYGPDHYGSGHGDNYGNMAGSLSYGYDGSNNYDPDWNRHYDPMSGHHRSYHGHYTSRHPEYYDERDRGQHNNDFRPLNRY